MIDSKLKKIISVGVLGNTLELYDYTLYGFFAAILATQFFPQEEPSAALMATYGIYASGFIFRPLGALLFGAIGDKYGRKRALELSILLMAIPTLLIGLLPAYAQIGILAPIFLTVLRFLQGLSVGGELVGSFTYLIEHADEGQKNFVGSWSLVGGFGGKLVGTFVAGTMSWFVAPTILENWGWRLPFIAATLFAAAGFFLRRQIAETPLFQSLQQENKTAQSPLSETWLHARKEMATAIGVLAIQPAVVHLLFIYFPIYMEKELGFTYTESFFSNFLALALCMCLIPIGGLLADRMGIKRVLLGGSISLSLFVYPAFVLITSGHYPTAVSMHLLLAACFGLSHGPCPAYLSQAFPTRIRYTASAITYNIYVCIFGGLSPLISTWLISKTGSALAPAWWLIFCALLSTFTLLTTEKRRAFV